MGFLLLVACLSSARSLPNRIPRLKRSIDCQGGWSPSTNSPQDQALILDSAAACPNGKRRPYEEAQRAKDRAELVRPTPPGFKPRLASVKITMIARDSKVKVGGSFWYRIELQNVGRNPSPGGV